MPRSETIGTSISSASSQVAKAASPTTRRRPGEPVVHEAERHVDERPVAARGAGDQAGDLVVGEALRPGELEPPRAAAFAAARSATTQRATSSAQIGS